MYSYYQTIYKLLSECADKENQKWKKGFFINVVMACRTLLANPTRDAPQTGEASGLPYHVKRLNPDHIKNIRGRVPDF